jgi:CPA2 family monovalent cation:H+ antiporter-2
MEHHLAPLIVDLGLILGAAAITTIIFKKLKQPLVLGYIIAGLLVGQQIKLFPSVTDEASIKTWAEIGVIFLLFSLGLEFSFKKLVRVGGAASITAFVEIIFIVVAGYFVGRWMGWNTVDCIFLGGMLASSSTTIILRAFDELGVKTKQFAKIVFGVLIVEDIVVILLLVLLPTLAISQKFEGGQLSLTVLKLGFFLALWFLTGIFLLPTLLKKAKKLLDDETMLVLSIALCLGMVVLATQVGFSAELGAFIMGSIFAETTSAEKVEHILKPVKDLFGAIFFVSVGLMIDLNSIWEYKWPVLIITGITIFGKLFSTTLGALISGQPLKQSVQVGMSMAQIGEFAFIIATLGLTLGVTSSFLFPIAVGVSAITTFTTPYMIRFSEPLHNLIVKAIPPKVLSRINKYSSNTQNLQARSEWKVALKSYAIIVVTNAVVVIAIVLISSNFLLPFMKERIANYNLSSILTLIITVGAMMPFLWAMAAKRPTNWAYKELWVNKKYYRGPLIVVELIRIMLAILLIGFLIDRLFSGSVALIIVLPIIITVLFVFSRKIQQFYSRIETRFISNLNARERAEEKAKSIQTNPDSELTPWDAHLADFVVHPLAPYIATDLQTLGWREKYGVNIALIKRGEKYIYAPGRFEKLYPHDTISVIGTDEQLQKFRPIVESKEELSAEQIANGNIGKNYCR